MQISLCEHFLSTFNETCRYVKLLNLFILFAGRKDGDRHWQSYKQEGYHKPSCLKLGSNKNKTQQKRREFS